MLNLNFQVSSHEEAQRIIDAVFGKNGHSASVKPAEGKAIVEKLAKETEHTKAKTETVTIEMVHSKAVDMMTSPAGKKKLAETLAKFGFAKVSKVPDDKLAEFLHALNN